MANSIEIANLNYRSLISTSSRYNKSKILYYGDAKFITFETYKRESYEASQDDKYYVINKGTEYRPDLVSYKAYGDDGYWWRIMEANGLSDIFDFKAGLNIVIPALVK